MKKLPIGIQSFEEIRSKEENYIYVDKTKFAYELITSGKYYFLSRPRRFGKSLFVSTLKALFEGKKELFEGLYIYDKWNWNEKYPVIHISFGSGVLNTKERITRHIKEIFDTNQKFLSIECEEKEYLAICFKELIEKAYEKYGKKVVILVDEYDKPILDNIDNPEMAIFAREELKNLYSVIKDCDPYLKFVFLTGVSKFSKTSIFSGLNNLLDITLDKNFGNICGYTQEELERYFADYLKGVDLEKVKAWYNGYNFLGAPLYNPFDILLFLKQDKAFKSYWFETGTPTFLLKLIEKNNYFLPSFSNLIVDEVLLDTFDVDNIKLEVLLFQTGYLTIDEVIRDEELDSLEYKLRFPNKEVKEALFKHIIDYLLKTPLQANKPLAKALLRKDLEAFKNALISLFASIPYNYYTKSDFYTQEGFYATVIFSYLQSVGFEVIGEDVTNRGRVDLTVKLPQVIYVMEIKVGEGDPLEQIKARRYYEKYLSEGKEIYLLGLRFDPKEKNLAEFKWERVS